MRVILDQVTKASALPATSVTFATGRAVLVEAETEQRPTVLSLIAAGRMRPETGSVTIDGETDYATMRSTIALVDAPGVSEPASDVTLAGVVAEELMFAGRKVRRSSVASTLAELGAAQYAKAALGDVPPAVRIRILCELALYRESVRGIVLSSPDRHGGEPAEWWAIAREIADRGYAVLVVAGRAAATALAPPPAVKLFAVKKPKKKQS